MLTGGRVEAKELVRLELIVDDQIVTVWGYVVYQVLDMGFAVRFVLQIEDDRRAIEHLIEHAQRTAV